MFGGEGQVANLQGYQHRLSCIVRCTRIRVAAVRSGRVRKHATPEAFAGVTREITDRLTALLTKITAEPILWRDILIDHAHGSGLSFASVRGEEMQNRTLREHYRRALDRLLDCLFGTPQMSPNIL